MHRQAACYVFFLLKIACIAGDTSCSELLTSSAHRIYIRTAPVSAAVW